MSARLRPDGITHCSPAIRPYTGPVAPTTAAVISAISRAGNPRGTMRVVMSRSVMNSTEMRASRLNELKPERPGRMTINTPAKPTAMAVHRRQPTNSFRKMAAHAVTASGIT